MPAKRRPPISVLGVLTIDGWDQRKKEFRNLYQTQTIVDIPWISLRRNRQAGHRMTISRENVWGTCMRNYSVSVINDGDSIKSFCSKYNVDEKHAERTYKDFKWDVTLTESGKIEKLKVKQLDFYLKEHGLTTIARKLDKVKAIRCHYLRHIKSLWTQANRVVPKMKVTGNQGMENMGKNLTVWRTRATMNLFSTIWMRRVTHRHRQTIQFISDDQICEESKNNHYFSLRSKRFPSSYRAKVRAGASQLFSTNSRGNACYAGYHYFWELIICLQSINFLKYS